MHLEPIAALLEEKGIGKRAKTIFINEMRVEDSGILLKPDYKGTAIDPELPGYFKGAFALVVRAKGYAAGAALIKRAMDALWIEQQTELADGMTVKWCRARTLPINYPVPATGVTEFVVNIDCCYVKPV
jgi:hypothetical protein